MNDMFKPEMLLITKGGFLVEFVRYLPKIGWDEYICKFNEPNYEFFLSYNCGKVIDYHINPESTRSILKPDVRRIMDFWLDIWRRHYDNPQPFSEQ